MLPHAEWEEKAHMRRSGKVAWRKRKQWLGFMAHSYGWSSSWANTPCSRSLFPNAPKRIPSSILFPWFPRMTGPPSVLFESLSLTCSHTLHRPHHRTKTPFPLLQVQRRHKTITATTRSLESDDITFGHVPFFLALLLTLTLCCCTVTTCLSDAGFICAVMKQWVPGNRYEFKI